MNNHNKNGKSLRYVQQLNADFYINIDALDNSSEVPKEIRQMLLVLQSVRQSPVSDQYYQFQSLVSKVVHPYVCLIPKSTHQSMYYFVNCN